VASYLIYSCRYQPLTGGVESYTKEMARTLVEGGDRVTIVTSSVAGEPAHELDESGAEVWRVSSVPLMGGRLPIPRLSLERREVKRALRHGHFDRVLVNTRFYPHSLEGLSLARELDLPAVVLDHGSAYLVLGNPLADAALRAYEHAMSLACKAFSPTFAGVSAASAQWLQTFGITCKAIIPNAIDAAAFRASATNRDFRRELKVSADQALVAFAGRLEKEKGPHLLAQATRLIDDGFVVAFAGTGSLAAEVERLGGERVRLLGTLSHADLSALFAASDALCLPTRSEGFCTVLLEAASWGTTPILPRVGGVDEVMGSPVRFGALLSSTEPATIAQTLTDRRDRGLLGHDPALMDHVERHCSWRASVRALRACFGDAD